MSRLQVHYNDVVVVDEREDGRYASWRTEYDFEVKGVGLSIHSWLRNEAVSIRPVVCDGDAVWVLYITYSSGDSFGRASGQGEILWVFVDETVAWAAQGAVERQRKSTAFQFVDEDGEDIHLSNPGCGYFEKIESVNIQLCVVGITE